MGWKEWRAKRREKKLATMAGDQASGLRDSITTSAQMGQLFTLISPPDGYLIPAVGWYDSDAERLITASSWCCTAITGNARAMGQLQPVVQKRSGRQWVAEDAKHPLWKWIDDPLGTDDVMPYWPWGQLIEWIAIHRYLFGNAFMAPIITGRRIFAVQPMLSTVAMIAEEDANGVPVRWTYNNVSLEADQVINVMAPNPGSFWRGLSPVKAALKAIDLDYFASERQKWQMRNKVSPGMIVGIETPMGLTEAQRQALQTSMTANYSDAENTGKPWVIGGSVTIHQPPTADALQYFDTRRFAREEILSAIGMPPPVAGVLDNAILSNFGVATVLWWNGYLLPVLTGIYNALNAQLVRRMYPEHRVWYDLAGSDVALQLLSERAKVAKQLVDLGYPTNAAARGAGLEMPEFPELDQPNTQFVNAGRVPPAES